MNMLMHSCSKVSKFNAYGDNQINLIDRGRTPDDMSITEIGEDIIMHL